MEKSTYQNYWEECPSFFDTDLYIKNYIEEIFPVEINHASIKNNPPEKEKIENLIMFMGYSLDPLLLMLFYHKPNNLFFLVNDKYSDDNDANNVFVGLKRIFEKISGFANSFTFFGSLTINGKNRTDANYLQKDDNYVISDESPQAIFKKINDIVKTDTSVDISKWCLDITGGKKSMITAGHLYAAHTGMKLSYLDFKEYDPKYGKPYGVINGDSNLVPTIIKNPYQDFSLAEWQDIRTAYNQYDFKRAGKILEKIKDATVSVYGTEIEDPINNLEKLLEALYYWEHGDYSQQKQISFEDLCRFNISMLDTFKKILKFKGTQTMNFKVQENFYTNPEFFSSYIIDEFYRIKRLIEVKKDYRSALIRCSGLNEVLFTIRFSLLFENNKLQIKDNTGNDISKEIKEQNKGAIKYAIYNCTGVVFMANSLAMIENTERSIYTTSIRVNSDSIKTEYHICCNEKDYKMKNFWATEEDANEMNCAKDIKNLGFGDNAVAKVAQLRNKAVHAVLSVDETKATNALKLVEFNIKEFEGFYEKLHKETINLKTNMELHITTWQEICQKVGLDKFLSPSLCK